MYQLQLSTIRLDRVNVKADEQLLQSISIVFYNYWKASHSDANHQQCIKYKIIAAMAHIVMHVAI